MQCFWDQYLPDRSKRHEPGAAPLLESQDQLAGLPGALVITAENDVVRDEGEAYGRKLSDAGVETVVTRYKGAIHDSSCSTELLKLHLFARHCCKPQNFSRAYLLSGPNRLTARSQPRPRGMRG